MDEIHLENFEWKHLDATFHWMQDEKLKEDFMLPFTVSKEGHQEWYKRYRADSSQKIWAILYCGLHVGNVGLKNIDIKNRKAEAWIYIGDFSLHGKRIGTGTWKALFRDVIFLTMDLHKIYSFVAEWNIASRKMFINAGFQEEGKLKDEVYFNHKFVSLYRLGMILDTL